VDYLIAGMAVGALLAILGFVLRELAMSRRVSGLIWFADAGIALMFAALVIWAITGAAFVANLEDGTASQVVFSTIILAVAGSAIAAIVSARAHRTTAAPRAASDARDQVRGTSVRPRSERSQLMEYQQSADSRPKAVAESDRDESGVAPRAQQEAPVVESSIPESPSEGVRETWSDDAGRPDKPAVIPEQRAETVDANGMESGDRALREDILLPWSSAGSKTPSAAQGDNEDSAEPSHEEIPPSALDAGLPTDREESAATGSSSTEPEDAGMPAMATREDGHDPDDAGGATEPSSESTATDAGETSPNGNPPLSNHEPSSNSVDSEVETAEATPSPEAASIRQKDRATGDS
jgi:hypothetical protein